MIRSLVVGPHLFGRRLWIAVIEAEERIAAKDQPGDFEFP